MPIPSFISKAVGRGLPDVAKMWGGEAAEHAATSDPAQKVQRPVVSPAGSVKAPAPAATQKTPLTRAPTGRAAPEVPPTDFLGRPTGAAAASPGQTVEREAQGAAVVGVPKETAPRSTAGENGQKEPPPKPPEGSEKPEAKAETGEGLPPQGQIEKAFRKDLLERHEANLKNADNKSFWDVTKEWLGSDWKNLLVPAGLVMMLFNNNIARFLGAVALGAGGYNLYQRGKVLLSDEHPHHDLATNAIVQSAAYVDPRTKENIPFGNTEQVVEQINQQYGPEAAKSVNQAMIDYQMAHRIGGTNFIMRQLANRQEQALREKYGRNVDLGYQPTIQQRVGDTLGTANKWIQSQWQRLTD